jgi:hypothetical protein
MGHHHRDLVGWGGTPADAYANRVLATSPLRYNKLNEASGTAIVDSSGNGYTGTYSGVTLANTDSPFVPDKAPFWDGANDYGNLYSAAFATAFNLDEFTIMLWSKVNSTAVWSDGATRRFFTIFRDASNFVRLGKSSTNGRLDVERTANGTAKNFGITGLSDTNYFSIAVSCSVAGGGLLAAGEMKAYINGVQAGATSTGNVAGSGSGLSSTNTVLGAANTTPALVWHGWQSNLIIWNRPIDAAILALMTP